MSAGVITIERKKYAVGLFWQPLPAGQNTRDFAKQLSKQLTGSVKFYAEFRSMIGVGTRALGHRRGMKIAAIEVINSFPEYNSFLVEFFTPQGFWIIAVRNNIIIFDQLFGAEAEAQREFIKLSALPDWGIIIAPANWSVPRSVEKSLRDIVSGNSKVALTTIGGAWGNVFSIAVFAIIASVLWYFFQDPMIKVFAPRAQQAQINPQVIEEYKRQLEIKKIQQEDIIPSTRVVMPYDNLPGALPYSEKCWQAIAYVMQPITGWVQQSAECVDNTASARFVRTYGTLAGLHESVYSLMGDVFIVENTDSDAVISVPFTPLPPAVNNTPQNLTENIVFSISSLFQTIGESANVRSGMETSGEGEAAVTSNVVIVSATSKLKPDEFIKIFDGISPLYLSSVKWDARTRTWNYEVKIYAK